MLKVLVSAALLLVCAGLGSGQDGSAAIEVLSHICKYGVISGARSEKVECWAALSYCKRDVERGPINPREPRDFQNFKLLEYRQELRVCSLNEFSQYKCVEKEGEVCFQVLRNDYKPALGKPNTDETKPGLTHPKLTLLTNSIKTQTTKMTK